MDFLLRLKNLWKRVKTFLQRQFWAHSIIGGGKAACELLALCPTHLEFGHPHQRNQSNCLSFRKTFQSRNTLCERPLILTPRWTRPHGRLRPNLVELSPCLLRTNKHL